MGKKGVKVSMVLNKGVRVGLMEKVTFDLKMRE